MDEVPEWVMGRSAIVQVDPETLISSVLLPSSDLVPLTPSTGRQSHTNATPRTSSKSNTPLPEDPDRLSPSRIKEYLLHRLLQPLFEMMKTGVILYPLSAVDILEQVNLLCSNGSEDPDEQGSMDSTLATEKLSLGDQLGSVALIVQAAVQISRGVSDPLLLSKLQENLSNALKKIGSDGVLSASDREVIQNLNNCSGPAFDQAWDTSTSSWSPWLLVGEEEEDDANVNPDIRYHVTVTRDARRLNWLIERMIKVGRPVVVVGGPGSGKTTTTLQALSSLSEWKIIRVNMTCATTAEDLENVILSQVTRTSHDTLIPLTPTVFCFDDLGCLPRNSRALSYLQGIVLHKGLFDNSEHNRWMNLCNVHLVGIISHYGEKWAYVEGVDRFSGWTIYNMDFNDDAATAYVSLALTPIGSLQSQIVSTMTSMTEAVAQKMSMRFSLRKEPFIPPNKPLIKWRVAAALREVFRSPQMASLPDMTGALILNVWLHAVTSEFLYHLHSQRRREKAWHEIQCCVTEGGMDIMGEVPSTLPIPLWPPGMENEEDSVLPKYLTVDEAVTQIKESLQALNVTEAAKDHIGIVLGSAIIADALRSLMKPEGTHTVPFLLLLGPLTRDKDVTLSIAADYLGVQLKTGELAEEVIELLNNARWNNNKTNGTNTVEERRGTTSLVLVPASLLRNSDVCKALLRVTTQGDTTMKNIVVVSGCKDQVWPLRFELRSVASHGSVVCLPSHTLEQHYAFVKQRLEGVKVLKEEPKKIVEEIADFVASLHLSYCAKEDLSTSRKDSTSPNITRGSTSIHTKFNQLPPVTSMMVLIDAFAKLLCKKKDLTRSTLNDLQKATSRVLDLENHVTSLRETHTNLETWLSASAVSITEISEKLDEKGANIENLEKAVTELRVEVATVERAYEELRGEVAEYIEETRAPLHEITGTLSQLDMPRIRKLLSRAPLSAIQALFECAVYLLGAADMSMKAVRHATHDNTFCKKLAAVCVTGLNQTQINTLTEKLEQIKMTNDHMARVSDIGGVLLTYMRALIFFWHRHNEDIQPREARVEALKENSKQLQVEIATKERLIRGLREEVISLKGSRKKEEQKVVSLKNQKISIEEELDQVLAVINELKPHSKRWQEEIDKQTMQLEQVTGQSLLRAACLIYLTALPPIERQNYTNKWEKDLADRGLLKQQIEIEDVNTLRLVSKPGDLQMDVKEFMEHYAASLNCLLLRDPHHVVEEYLSGGVWIGTETERWKEEVQERLSRAEKTLFYLWSPHSRAREVVKWIENYLEEDIKDEEDKTKRMTKILIIIDGDCAASSCPLCSTHTVLDISLNYKGTVHKFLRAILKWHSPSLEVEVQKSVRNVSQAQVEKERAEENLLESFINSQDLTATSELESFTDHVKVLNVAMAKENDSEAQLNDLTSQVSAKYLYVSRYITRLYQVTHFLAPLNSSYSIPLTLLQESLAHKMTQLSATQKEEEGKDANDEANQIQQLTDVATISVHELLDARLHLQHRLTVATCFALAKLDMENLAEDYVSTFLIPMEKGSDVWRTPGEEAQKDGEGGEEPAKGEDKEGQEEEEGEEDAEKLETIAEATEDLKEGEEEEEQDEEDEGNEEEIEEKDSDEEPEEEEEESEWIPKECDAKTRRVLGRITSECATLFPLPTVGEPLKEEVSSRLLKWLREEEVEAPHLKIFAIDDDIKKASQAVILARHLRPDQLITAMKKLVEMNLTTTLLKPKSGVLSRAMIHHWRPQMTQTYGISDLIQIHVGRGTQPLQDLVAAAKEAGLPYYKLTYLSMATASPQELRRRVVMAARRKTWLVLLDCEVVPDSLWAVHAALKLLPQTLSTPTVLCLIAKGLHSMAGFSSTVVAKLETPISLSSNIATHLQLGYDYYLQGNVSINGGSSGRTQASILATAYIYGLLQTRRMYGKNCWISRPHLTQVIFKESLSAAHYHTQAYSGKTSWDTLAALLAKVVYGSVVTSDLDQNVIDKIFSDHLNDKSYTTSTKPMKVHRQASVGGSPSPEGTTEQPGPAGDGPETSPVATISTTDLLGPTIPQPPHLGAQGNILLHSFPDSKLSINLQLSPQHALERVCEEAEVSESQLLGLSEHYRHLQGHQELFLSLEVFTTTPWVSVPKGAVMRMLKGLQAALPGPLGPRAAQMTREEDLETLAWQQETAIWDHTQEIYMHRLLQIKEAVASGCAHPAQALLVLADLVRESILDPDACVSSDAILRDEVRVAALDNLTSLWATSAIATDVEYLIQEWKARHDHLLSWAESETAPAIVRLGIMKLPGWWLTRLRQAVCTKAHWLLHGSLVFAVPSRPNPAERPNQGAYICGGNLVGGRWYNDKIHPDTPHGPNLPVSLTVTVSHAAKPTPVGCTWVPVLEKRRAKKPLFQALLPLHSSVAATRTPVHIILH